MTGTFTAHHTSFKAVQPGPWARLNTALFFPLLQDAAQPTDKGRRDHDTEHNAHSFFSLFHLISFLWNPYRPMAVHTTTQKAPTSHACPR